MSDLAIVSEGLSKRYRLGTAAARYGRLTETMWDAIQVPFKALTGRRNTARSNNYFWALKDVSFSLRQGEVVGIIGRNGAGKTTLLKLLSSITDPTEGHATLKGRVGALLEVGAGFHPELSGRENVYLNGAVLGMKRADIRRRFDEIVTFAEVERFIDTPVKRYSSGMYLRLAFAIAAHLEPDILIVDEVLAVGDAAFQKRCLGKIGDVATSGRTVLFVSHNMGAIRSLCERAILLEGGKLVLDTDPATAITAYLSNVGVTGTEGIVSWSREDAPQTEEVALRKIQTLGQSGEPRDLFEADQPITVEVHYEVKKALSGARILLAMLTQEGELAFLTTDHNSRQVSESPGMYKSVCTIPGGQLNRRSYVLAVTFDVPGRKVLLPRKEYLTISVAGAGNQGSDYTEAWPGVVCPRLDWRVVRMADDDVVDRSTPSPSRDPA